MNYFYCMELKYFKNIDNNVYEIMLHGVVGKEINGGDIAREIVYISNSGAEKIIEHINTIGGAVVDGFSIVSANIAAKCTIETINEGIADSTGSWILASGTKGHRKAMDFSQSLLHLPAYFDNENNLIPIEEIQDMKVRNRLEMMRDSIATILSNNSKKSKDEIIELMSNNTQLTAQDQKEIGLIDSIIKSENKPNIVENMSLAEVMNICKDFKQSKINRKISMKVNQFLNLNTEADDNAQIEAIKKIQNRAETAESKVSGLETEVQTKSETISNLEKEVETYRNEAISAAVNVAIESGKFDKEKKDELTELAKDMGVKNFNSMVEMTAIAHVDAASQVNNKSEQEKQNKEDKDVAKAKADAKEFYNLSMNNPAELEKMEQNDPKKFERIYNASIEYDFEDVK